VSAELATGLVGAWELLAYEATAEDGGEIEHPLGDDAAGLLVYIGGGLMSVQLMRRDRPRWTPGAAPSAEGYLAYAGRWEVDEAARTVTHHVELSLLPNWVGRPQVRQADLAGDRLRLTAPPERIGGRVAVARLSWRRA
jgi:hypothetical protein